MPRVYDPEPAFPLTADVLARAIVAAAQAFGDHPVKALTGGRQGMNRRALTATVVGVHEASGATIKRVARILDVELRNVYTARTKGTEAFLAAACAARDAITPEPAPKPLRIPVELDEPMLPEPVAEPEPAPSIAVEKRDTAKAFRPVHVPGYQPPKTRLPTPAPKPAEQYRSGRRGRAFPKDVTFQNLGDGVQVVRLKPISDATLARAKSLIGPGFTLDEFADLFDVDADRLRDRLAERVTA